jgi:hypothetical protein
LSHFMLPCFPPTFSLPYFFFPFLFPLLHLLVFPFFFYPFFSPCLVTILSHILVIRVFVGSRVHGLENLHLHPLAHVISPLLHLVIFQLHGFMGSSPHPSSYVTFTLHPKFCDLHFDHQPCHECRASKYFIPLACKSDRPYFYT